MSIVTGIQRVARASLLAVIAILTLAQAATAESGPLLVGWVKIKPPNHDPRAATEIVVLNHGGGTITVTTTFRRRGTPEDNPPTTSHRVAAGGTLDIPDVIKSFPTKITSPGAVVITSDGDSTPVLTAYATTLSTRGKLLSRVVESTDADVAQAGQSQDLVGLRQDAGSRTSLFLFDPSDEPASYVVTFVAQDGHEIGSLRALQVEPGLGTELDASSFPPPANHTTGPFNVRVDVVRGALIGSAEVMLVATGTPAYVQGVNR